MQIPFTKMNSQGNDFIVIDNTKLLYKFTNDQIKSICSRTVIGCDQLLLLTIIDSNHINCMIFNQDGSPAEQCGNGMRAIMLFLYKTYDYAACKVFVNDKQYSIQYVNSEVIKVDMGIASFDEKIPALLPKGTSISIKNIFFDVKVTNEGSSLSFSYAYLTIGNPHCIVFSNNSFIHKKEISSIINSIYENGVNISFVLNLDNFINGSEKNLLLRVNERGSGWTKSCGSGATATGAFILKLISRPEYGGRNINQIFIEQEGGILEVSMTVVQNSVLNNSPQLFLSGPTTLEYDGVWHD
jgi:diaminopimelate epimerase